MDSVRRTGRLVIADETNLSCGVAAEIAAIVAEDGFEFLRAQIVRVTRPDVPTPFSKPLEDAITLSKAFAAKADVRAALQTFEDLRRPGMEKVLDIAQQSYKWYETFHEKMDLDPLVLAYSYMTRSGRLDAHTLRQSAPRFMAEYDAYTAATSGAFRKR